MQKPTESREGADAGIDRQQAVPLQLLVPGHPILQPQRSGVFHPGESDLSLLGYVVLQPLWSRGTAAAMQSFRLVWDARDN